MTKLLRAVLISLLLPVAAHAADTFVPEQLQGWQEWVLDGREYRECPFFFNRGAVDQGDFVCAWPGSLDLSVTADGGHFAQQWTVYADEQWLPLPGDSSYWPDQVTSNGRAIEVVMHAGVPSLLVGSGSYRLAGSFEWDERPGVLRIPRQSGLVALSVNGQSVARPEFNGNSIFLGERQRETTSQDAVSANVYRLVEDNVPTRLTTSIRIDVSGGVREELFGPVLPEGFIPLAINSQLPARLEPDGKLRVQVRPGRWEIILLARAPEVLNAVTLAASDENLPDSEIWSYRSNDRLRVTAAEGLPPVDPQQVQVPGHWQALPAFRIEAGQTLEIAERSRGLVATENQLSLRRQMWLDFNGDGFTVSDNIAGTMRTGWRLDMELPFALLSATESDQNLLITDGQDADQTGVELRSSSLRVGAIGRADTRKRIPVTGWNARFADVTALLHLPPGHKLLAAPGADRAPGSWVSQWQLLDFFLLLIITIAAWRLFGRTAGVIALLALAMSFHEFDAPVWLWLNLLVAVALMRVAPEGRLRQSVRAYQVLSAVALVIALVPFIASQLRTAIYPQLEAQYDVGQLAGYGRAGPEPELALSRFNDQGTVNAPASLAQDALVARKSRVGEAMALEEVAVTAQKFAMTYARYAPNAIVQTGPGIPSWRWNSYGLSWSGPVDAEQSMRLVILPRWAVSTLRFVEVLLLLLFATVLTAEILKRRFALPGGLVLGSAKAGGFFAVGILTLLMSISPVVEAQTPDSKLLQELQQRLLQPPECAPRCAELVAADVDVAASNVSMSLTIHALADVAVPLPGSDRGWRPGAILLDGTAAGQVIRGADQSLWLRLTAGRHNLRLSGPIPAADSLEIPFPTPPRVIKADGDGWFIAGIKDRRLLSGSLQLTRLQSEGNGDAAVRWESSRFPAFIRIERSVELDLDWHVTTTVHRIAPSQGALTLNVPLIDGESVLSDGFTVAEGSLLVSMNPNQSAVSWRSSLPRVSPLVLTTESGQPWKEVWSVGVGSIWHAEFSGVPESETGRNAGDARIAEFNPRGGESLTIAASRPEASQGSTLAFDSVDLWVEHGSRSSSAAMELDYRSTRGAQHVLRLPADAEVTQVVIDGQIEPLRAEAGELTVPILPGEHSIGVNWRINEELGSRTATPAVDIGAPASNIALHLQLPANRWMLGTNGPRLGPAVLYWSELAVLLLFAAILGRIKLTPLKTRHWLLLGLGFSTFSWPVLGVVIGWLLLCGARAKWDTEETWWRFNLVQVIVAAATVIALLSILTSLPSGLLGSPDMQVTGNGSQGNSLSWFADRSNSVLPVATSWSVPMWSYKVLILGWALWLSFALLRWLPWVWQCFSSRGYWHSRAKAT
jgi:hypothetical protein